MTKVLVKIYDDWADEMSVEGFCIMSKDKLDKFLSDVKKYFEDNPGEILSYSIGTNEEIEHRSFESVNSCISFKEISDEQAAVVTSNVGRAFGTIGLLEILDYV